MALVREILRQRRRRLTLVRNLMCTEGELMMVAGAVEKVVTAWMSIGLPWGVSKIMREHVESGRVPLEEWSHLALGLRFHAAAMGVPFLPTLTMLGSDLMGVGGTQTLRCPYTGETLALVPALFPDVALLHVHRADRFGNCQIDGYPHMDADIARAASTVLVTAEEIIPDAEVRRHPDRIRDDLLRRHQHRHLPPRPARLHRLRLHRRRPDRPPRQPQHERDRPRVLEADGAAAGLRRRQRHCLALQRGHRAHPP